MLSDSLLVERESRASETKKGKEVITDGELKVDYICNLTGIFLFFSIYHHILNIEYTLVNPIFNQSGF